MENQNKEVFTKVQRESDNKYNFIDANGKLLLDEWFEWIGDFYDGLARVQRSDKKYNFINKDGKLISDEWFKWVDFFQDGLARVQREDDLMNYINTDGKLLSNEWFEWVDDFDKHDLAVVCRTNGECCKIERQENRCKKVSNNKNRERNGNEKSEINL